jgi:acyl-CoA reductase-like NAD-dependent aldehyde dehydrogenase
VNVSSYPVLDPSSEQVLTEVELADLARTDAVIEAADAAGPVWRAVPPGERARLLRRFATLVE